MRPSQRGYSDILEDSDATHDDLVYEFNGPVADLVMEAHPGGERGGGTLLPPPRIQDGRAREVRGPPQRPVQDGGLARDPAAESPEMSEFWPKGPPGDTIGSPNGMEDARAPPTRWVPVFYSWSR